MPEPTGEVVPAYRSIRLQSPYCGAKHPIEGFTRSLRTALEHEASGVHLAIVDMPGVNTPQFEWCKTTSPTTRSRAAPATSRKWPDAPFTGPRMRAAAKRRGWLWAGAALGIGLLALNKRRNA